MHHPFRVGVVGTGRVGAVLAARLAAAGHPVVAASARSELSRARAAALLPDVALRTPAQVARECELMLLAVPDDALETVVAELAGEFAPGSYLVHTSGRHGRSVLAPAADRGVHTLAVHPAMTFTGTERDLPRLAECVVGVTAAPADREVAAGLVADLGGRTVELPEQMRTLYHAGLAHGANHLVTLVSEAREILRAAGVEDPAGTLRPLLTAALDNALESGDAALTGPVVRGDAGTVAGHLDDLGRHAPHTVGSYVALAQGTLARAEADGRVDAGAATALRRTLRAHDLEDAR